MGSIFGLFGDIFHAVFYEPVYNVLILLYHVTNNFPISIVLLTVLIRSCLIPLTRKQLQSSRKMQELQPQLNALKAQYRGDPQGLMAAQRELFKENNYSQMQGCLPLVVQLPVLYALFGSFTTLIGAGLTSAVHIAHINNDIYPFLPKVTHLLSTKFLWTDLAAPDQLHILPFIAAIFTLVQLRMAMPVRPKPQPGQPPDPTAQASKFTMYLMPCITFLFGLNFPAGMALYWSVGTLFMVVQQYFLAGFGSLFVGIPGMERFVPPPKQTLLPEPPVGRNGARPGTYSAASSARSALVETTTTKPKPAARPATPAPASAPATSGGGFFARLREQMAEAQRQAQEANAARQRAAGTIVDSTIEADEDDEEQDAISAEAQTANRQQRQRPTKQAPLLVKPSHTPATSALPSEPLTRVGTNGATTNGAKSNGNGSTATNGANGGNGSNGVKVNGNGANGAKSPNGATNGKRVAAGSASTTRPLSTGQRKGSGGAKGAASTRTRPAGAGNAARPKGGR